LLHRVETLVELVQPCPLDTLTWFVLKAAHIGGGASLEALNVHLQLGSLLRQVLHLLESRSLIQRDDGSLWSLTTQGREALETGVCLRPVHGRRIFYFRKGEEPNQSPRWLALREPPGTSPWEPSGEWHFDVRAIEACVNRPDSWKEQHHFPRDVRRIVSINGPHGPLPDWQCVPLDRAERLLAVLVLVRVGGSDQLFGFAARQEGWTLNAAEPVFVLAEDWAQTFPELAAEPDPAEWRQAWLNWCQPRGLPVVEVEGCQLQLDRMRLCIRAPDRLVERFRATRSDVLKSEAWLLAGQGNLRRAAAAEIVP
jgi:hypothetical protein